MAQQDPWAEQRARFGTLTFGKERQAQQQGKKKGKGGLLSSLISEGGALGGAAVGTAILPGIGTLVGAGLGAFGGRLAENKVRDDRWGVGDAAKEGGLTAALAGAAPAFRALKGGKAAVGAVEKSTALERGARSALGNAWGVKSGEKLGGQLISPQRATKLQRFVVDDIQVPKTANADRVFEAATSFRDKTGSTIADALSTSGATLNTNPLRQSLTKQFGTVIGADGKNNPIAKDILKQVRAAKTPADLWQVRRNVDDLVSFTRGDNAAVPGTEQIARAARKQINAALKTVVPEYGPLSKQYSRASDVFELSGKAARTPRGARLPGMLGGVAGPQVQSLRSAVGQSALKSSDRLQKVAANQPLRGAKKTALPVLGESLLNSGAPQEAPIEEAPLDEPALMDQQQLPPTEETSDSPFDPANVEANVQNIVANGGSMKDVKEYVSLVEALQGIRGAASGGAEKPLSAEASKIVSNANIGIQALDDFDAAVAEDPSILGKRIVPGRGLAGGLLGAALGTRGADAAANQIVDVIARLRTGAAITNDEARRFETFIPQAGDSPDVRRQKLGYLRNQFQAVASRTGSAGTDLQSALLQ